VLELRVSGMTERAIADEVGAAPSTVHVDLVDAVDRWVPWEQAAEWQVLTVRRLELAMCRWWRLAIDEDAVVVVVDDEGRERCRPATTADRAAATAVIARLLPELRRWTGLDRHLELQKGPKEPEDMTLDEVDEGLGRLVEVALARGGT
jgi:hypothetical protein